MYCIRAWTSALISLQTWSRRIGWYCFPRIWQQSDVQRITNHYRCVMSCSITGEPAKQPHSFKGHFPRQPWQAVTRMSYSGFYRSWGWKSWWWQVYWIYKTCKAPVKSSPPTHQYQHFYRPHARPVAQPTASQHWRKRNQWKKRSQRHKHCALAVVRRSQIFSPCHRPLSRGRGTVCWGSMHTISSYHGKSFNLRSTRLHIFWLMLNPRWRDFNTANIPQW